MKILRTIRNNWRYDIKGNLLTIAQLSKRKAMRYLGNQVYKCIYAIIEGVTIEEAGITMLDTWQYQDIL